MSGAVTATVVAGAVGAAVAGSQIYSSRKQSKATKSAANAQRDASNRTLASQQQAYNKANQQQVDMTSMLEQNSASEAGTNMLTGGVQQGQYNLGKGYNLLGG